MLGVFAEFETSLRKEWQLEGIAKAKKSGKYKGRQPTAKANSHQIINFIKERFTHQAVADKLNIGIASVYRILKEYQENNKEVLLPGSLSKLLKHYQQTNNQAGIDRITSASPVAWSHIILGGMFLFASNDDIYQIENIIEDLKKAI